MNFSSHHFLPKTFVVCSLVLFGFYHLRLKPLLSVAGVWRDVSPIGNEACTTVPQLQACEKIVLHQDTGILYLACSDPQTRVNWMPAMSSYNPPIRSTDYIATYNPSTSQVERLELVGFHSAAGFGISVHGMDVVSSSLNSQEVFVYLVNHRPPRTGDPSKLGADSVIEIFKTKSGRAGELIHVQTIEHPLVVSPNDVVGSPDGKSFYFTNDNPVKIGHFRKLASILFHAKDNNVVYCHIETGCKIALQNLNGANGITKSPWNETYYVANHRLGGVRVLERQFDDTLISIDDIPTDRNLDNISVDRVGHIWAAGMPKVFTSLTYFTDPSRLAPSSALRISIDFNTSWCGGSKYRVDKVFEDEGTLASGSTSAVFDPKNKRLFVHGLVAPHLTICDVDVGN